MNGHFLHILNNIFVWNEDVLQKYFIKSSPILCVNYILVQYRVSIFFFNPRFKWENIAIFNQKVYLNK